MSSSLPSISNPHQLESVRTCQQVTALRRTDIARETAAVGQGSKGRCRHDSGLAHRVLRVPENRCRAQAVGSASNATSGQGLQQTGNLLPIAVTIAVLYVARDFIGQHTGAYILGAKHN
jgi:hypothetical protein